MRSIVSPRVAGAGAAAALVLLLAPSSVPLYDGVGFPDQPYRYVAVPAGAPHGPAPTAVRVSSPATGGHNSQDLTVQSGEQGPQILTAAQRRSARGSGTPSSTCGPPPPSRRPR